MIQHLTEHCKVVTIYVAFKFFGLYSKWEKEKEKLRNQYDYNFWILNQIPNHTLTHIHTHKKKKSKKENAWDVQQCLSPGNGIDLGEVNFLLLLFFQTTRILGGIKENNQFLLAYFGINWKWHVRYMQNQVRSLLLMKLVGACVLGLWVGRLRHWITSSLT